jgi:gliding motility-associated lipoprotein GldH
MILLNKTTRPTKMRVFVIFLVSVLLQVSCTDSDIVTEAKTDMNENYWPQKNNVSFPFEVEDVSQSYSVFYTMRYNQDYPYYNIWVNRLLFDANGNMLSKKLQGMELFNSSTGEPYGGGFGNYFDYKILSDSNYHFPSKGKYTLTVEQYMRQDTLKGIASVGIEIIKNDR